MTKIYNHTAMLLVSSLLLGGCSGNETNKQDTTYITNTQNTNTTIEDNVTDTNTTQQITTYVDNNVTITPQSVDTNETQTEDNNNSHDDNETQTTPTNEVDTIQQETTQPEDNTTTTPQSVDTNETQTEDNTTTSDTNTTDTNDTSVTEGNDENTTQQTNTEIKALKLTIQKSTLNKDSNTTLKVEALYKNNTKEDVTTKVEWIEDKKGVVSIYDHILTAKEDKDITLQAKLDNKTSNPIKLHIYWKVNNHTLPPEPDPKVNNATLLGVDVNNNGVRDDVERKIYEKYPVKLQRALMMDSASVFQETMTKPLSEAISIAKKDTKMIDCEIYLGKFDKNIDSDEWVDEGETLKNITFNTKERVRKYLDYNLALSGGVYGSSPSDWNRDACSEEIKQVLAEMGL
jgi:hypothetical protein